MFFWVIFGMLVTLILAGLSIKLLRRKFVYKIIDKINQTDRLLCGLAMHYAFGGYKTAHNHVVHAEEACEELEELNSFLSNEIKKVNYFFMTEEEKKRVLKVPDRLEEWKKELEIWKPHEEREMEELKKDLARMRASAESHTDEDD